MKKAEALRLERVLEQVVGLHAEMSELARKRPNDAVNEFKLNLVNGVLEEVEALLGAGSKPLAGFDKFELDASPSNSDVTMVIAQYIKALDARRSEQIVPSYGGRWVYKLSDTTEDIYTSPPSGAKRKF